MEQQSWHHHMSEPTATNNKATCVVGQQYSTNKKKTQQVLIAHQTNKIFASRWPTFSHLSYCHILSFVYSSSPQTSKSPACQRSQNRLLDKSFGFFSVRKEAKIK
jgi:hypothetical protein